MTRLRGAIAAAVTPLRDRGGRLDDEAFGPYVDFLVGAGLDGMLAFGTNGEAVLLSVEERTRGLELWLDAARGARSSRRIAAPRRRPTRSRSPPMRARRAPTRWR